jgi:hypothetical protein
MRVLVVLGIALLSLTASGCVNRASVGYGEDRHYHDGPPPHAPAHGYRAKHHHRDMVYDSRLGAYVVLGYRDHYYHDGWYFRYFDGFWQISAELGDRKWRDVDRYRVPEGLRYSKHRYRDREYRDYRDRRDDRDYDDHRDRRHDRDYDDRRYKDNKKRARDHDDHDDDHQGHGRGRGYDDDWDD